MKFKTGDKVIFNAGPNFPYQICTIKGYSNVYKVYTLDSAFSIDYGNFPGKFANGDFLFPVNSLLKILFDIKN